jgi:hypothetical protein
MLRSDEVFSILFVHILLVKKKKLRLLLDSSSYFTALFSDVQTSCVNSAV